MEAEIVTKSGKKLLLREPKAGDAKYLLELINEVVAEDEMISCNQKQTLEGEEKYLDGLLKDIADEQMVKLLAFDGTRLVGACDIKKGKYRSSHVGLYGIIVSKPYRNDGLGRQLSELTIKIALERLNLTLIELHVYNLNMRARKLYQSLGFTECGLLPGAIQYKDQLIDQIHMYKMVE